MDRETAFMSGPVFGLLLYIHSDRSEAPLPQISRQLGISRTTEDIYNKVGIST